MNTANANRPKLKFRRLCDIYSIVRLAPDAPIPAWAIQGEFTSISRTADELSIVCSSDHLPIGVHSPHRWICLQLSGPFPFDLTGILLSFIEPLSTNGVPIFAISTFDTDYILIQEKFADTALQLLAQAGHTLVAG